MWGLQSEERRRGAGGRAFIHPLLSAVSSRFSHLRKTFQAFLPAKISSHVTPTWRTFLFRRTRAPSPVFLPVLNHSPSFSCCSALLYSASSIRVVSCRLMVRTACVRNCARLFARRVDPSEPASQVVGSSDEALRESARCCVILDKFALGSLLAIACPRPAHCLHLTARAGTCVLVPRHIRQPTSGDARRSCRTLRCDGLCSCPCRISRTMHARNGKMWRA